jgi:hypothetical protein
VRASRREAGDLPGALSSMFGYPSAQIPEA